MVFGKAIALEKNGARDEKYKCVYKIVEKNAKVIQRKKVLGGIMEWQYCVGERCVSRVRLRSGAVLVCTVLLFCAHSSRAGSASRAVDICTLYSRLILSSENV